MQRPRTPSRISESLHQRLNSYALAASAAGVGILALAQPAEYAFPMGAGLASLFVFSEPAEARIVYTPVHKRLPCNHRTYSGCSGSLKLDLHRHRRTDFILRCGGGGEGGGLGIEPKNSGNEILRTSTSRRLWAAALSYGAVIESNSHFQQGEGGMFTWDRTSHTFSSGPWAHGVAAYLGLRFFIRENVHYGWARVITYADAWNTNKYATLGGYAYETIPNKPIIAGKTKGPDVITVEAGSLGDLARGSLSYAMSRKRNARK